MTHSIKDTIALISELSKISNEDLLINKDTIAVESDEGCGSDCDCGPCSIEHGHDHDHEKPVKEDYEGDAPYGDTRDEVVNNLMSKYFGFEVELGEEGDVTASGADVRTALLDAYAAGADKSVSDEGSTIVTESVDTVQRNFEHTNIKYTIDSETGVVNISVEVPSVTASMAIVSDVLHRRVNDIIANADLTTEEAIERMTMLRATITSVLENTFNSSTFVSHISDQVRGVLEAYAPAVEHMINQER